MTGKLIALVIVVPALAFAESIMRNAGISFGARNLVFLLYCLANLAWGIGWDWDRITPKEIDRSLDD